MGTVAVSSAGSVAHGTAAITPGTPDTMNNGDLVFYLIQCNGISQTLTAGDFTGWTLLSGITYSAQGTLWLYVRFKDSGWSTIPGSIDVSSTSRTVAYCWSMSGFDYTDLSTIVVDWSEYYYSNSVAWPCGGVTVSGLGSDLFILAVGLRKLPAAGFTGAKTITDPSGYTKLQGYYTGTTEFHQLYTAHWLQQSGAASDIADEIGDFWNESDPVTGASMGIRIALKTASSAFSGIEVIRTLVGVTH